MIIIKALSKSVSVHYCMGPGLYPSYILSYLTVLRAAGVLATSLFCAPLPTLHLAGRTVYHVTQSKIVLVNFVQAIIIIIIIINKRN